MTETSGRVKKSKAQNRQVQSFPKHIFKLQCFMPQGSGFYLRTLASVIPASEPGCNTSTVRLAGQYGPLTQSNHNPSNRLKYQPWGLKNPLSLMKNTSATEAAKVYELQKKNMIWEYNGEFMGQTVWASLKNMSALALIGIGVMSSNSRLADGFKCF